MRRRAFISVLGGAAATWPLAVRRSSAATPAVIAATLRPFRKEGLT